jgi:hypothetical protein
MSSRTTIALFIAVLASVHVYGQDSPMADTLARRPLKKADSIKYYIDSRIKLETTHFNKGLDSLKNLNLPKEAYLHRVDSAYRAFQANVVQRYRNGSNTLDAKTGHYLDKVDSVLSARTDVLDSLLRNNGLQFSNNETLTERLDLSMPGLPDTGISIPSVNDGVAIPVIENPVLGSPTALPDIPANGLKDISGKPEELGALQTHVQTLAAEGDKVKEGEAMPLLEKGVEDRMMKTKEMQDLKAETKTANALKDQAKALKNKKSSPDSAKTMLKKKFVDHFAGKEEVVQKNLEDIAKVQLKYGTFADSRVLPKRPPNEMKGKPFIERLVPGITLQVFKQGEVSVDVAPFVGYRFSGHISAGIGGYRRLTYFEKSDHLSAVRCYGYRLFGSVKVIQSFNAYTDIEYFNNNAKPSNSQQRAYFDSSQHWKWNLGIQKRYSLGKNFFGHFILLYNLVKIKKFPNTEGASVRFGVDYQIKNKKRKVS